MCVSPSLILPLSIKLNMFMLVFLMVTPYMCIMLVMCIFLHIYIWIMCYIHLNSKLCSSLSCNVKFLANKCVMHDVKSQRMIGLGDQSDGLYKLSLSDCSLCLLVHLSFILINMITMFAMFLVLLFQILIM